MRRAKILGIVITVFITLAFALMAGLLYQSANRPAWSGWPASAVKEASLLKIDVPIDGTPADIDRRALAAARETLRRTLRRRAFAQIAMAYDWDHLDEATRSTVGKALDDALSRVTFDTLHVAARYTDIVQRRMSVLYTLDAADGDALLQPIYETVNQAVLKTLSFDDEELPESNTTVKDIHDENATRL